MRINIQKFTIAEAHRVTNDPDRRVSLKKLIKLLGLVIVQSVVDGQTLRILSMWKKLWRCALFRKTMPCYRLLEIIKHLRFNLKFKKSEI